MFNFFTFLFIILLSNCFAGEIKSFSNGKNYVENYGFNRGMSDLEIFDKNRRNFIRSAIQHFDGKDKEKRDFLMKSKNTYRNVDYFEARKDLDIFKWKYDGVEIVIDDIFLKIIVGKVKGKINIDDIVLSAVEKKN